LLRLKEKRASQEDASCSSSEESSYEEQDVSYAYERSKYVWIPYLRFNISEAEEMNVVFMPYHQGSLQNHIPNKSSENMAKFWKNNNIKDINKASCIVASCCTRLTFINIK
jgi:hypothetical protein